jgi:hypothetical protein
MEECKTVKQIVAEHMGKASLSRRIGRLIWRPWMHGDLDDADKEARGVFSLEVMDLLGALMRTEDNGALGALILASTPGRNPATRAARDALAYAFGALESPPSLAEASAWTSEHEVAFVEFAKKVSGEQSAADRFAVDESATGALADSMNYGISSGEIRWPTEAYEARRLAEDMRQSLPEGVDRSSVDGDSGRMGPVARRGRL